MPKFDMMYENKKLATVEFDYLKRKASVKNFTDNVIFRPFGIKTEITIDDVERLLEDRCFPKERRNKDELLELLGLSNIGYDPYNIVQVTHGVILGDRFWIKFDGENLDFDKDINKYGYL